MDSQVFDQVVGHFDERTETLVIQYAAAVAIGPAEAGNMAAHFTDAEAKLVFDAIKTVPCLKNKAVRCLWFCYERQQFRWT